MPPKIDSVQAQDDDKYKVTISPHLLFKGRGELWLHEDELSPVGEKLGAWKSLSGEPVFMVVTATPGTWLEATQVGEGSSERWPIKEVQP